MTIRTYEPGDELAQVSIYNEAAAELPKFQPATVDEMRRRFLAPDFDPGSRFYAVVGGKAVGYAALGPGGRVSYPWCRKGHERWGGPLLERVCDEARRRGLDRVLAAYRKDWAPPHDFFLAHGFRHARDMANFTVDVVELPTPAARPAAAITALTRADLPALLALGGGVLHATTVEALERHFFQNPYMAASSLFLLRGKTEGQPLAAGLVVASPEYAEPGAVDPWMPCFRLGAFGTEGLTHKRINGLFSFVAPDQRDLSLFGLDLVGHALQVLADTDVGTLAAQVATDVPHLHRFYRQYFRLQGTFPVYERPLAAGG